MCTISGLTTWYRMANWGALIQGKTEFFHAQHPSGTWNSSFGIGSSILPPSMLTCHNNYRKRDKRPWIWERVRGVWRIWREETERGKWCHYIVMLERREKNTMTSGHQHGPEPSCKRGLLLQSGSSDLKHTWSGGSNHFYSPAWSTLQSSAASQRTNQSRLWGYR